MNLEIKNLSFKFEKELPYFFKDVSFEINSKKINFICGPNGSGKSTLFRILQGKVNKNEELLGQFYLSGQEYDFAKDKNVLINNVKLVRQKFELMLADNFSFKQNLQFSKMDNIPLIKVLPKYNSFPEITKDLNIDINKKVCFLSGGQKQILSILMILQKPTKVLILDEPTAALDEKNANLVMTFLQKLVSETDLIVFIISHDANLVKKYSRGGYLVFNMNSESGIRSINKISL